MDELVQLVVQKTGVSEQQAQGAVDTVLDYLKDKLPDPIAGQIDGLIAGDSPSGSMEDITKGLGGLLGNK
jgi:hypothetical protein